MHLIYKKWEVVDPDENGDPITTVYTYQDIIDEYYLYWCNEMCRCDKHELITKDNCVEDWVVINWAKEIE